MFSFNGITRWGPSIRVSILFWWPILGWAQIAPQSPSQSLPVPAVPAPGNSFEGSPPVVNQPVMVSSYESVEMERLRVAQETGKMAAEESKYREQVLLLQEKLAKASLAALPADQLPLEFFNNFRSFLSANEGDVARCAEYYKLLQAILNNLIPKSPFSTATGDGKQKVTLAEENLERLFSYPEDEEISRNIMLQIAAVRGMEHETGNRRIDVKAELARFEKRKQQLLWNISQAQKPNRLEPEKPGPNAGRVPMYEAELKELEEQAAKLKLEDNALTPAIQKAMRELQFHKFIIELAFQQRYIHSRIASGFFLLYSRNTSIPQEAYPQNQGASQPGMGTSPAGTGGSPSGDSSSTVPYFSTLPALNTFLDSRIRDVAKDREALDNMLKTNRLSAAEDLIRKLVMIAKYQPELNTIPYEERQRVLRFGEDVRRLSDALKTRNYTEIAKLADGIDKASADPGMEDVRAFAQEHPKKALRWVSDAEIALKVGDPGSMRSLKEAALARAPLDEDVEKAIRELEKDILEGGNKKEDLQNLVNDGDYRTISEKWSEFAPLIGSGADPDLKAKTETLIEKEKKIQEALKKCEEFESRSSYPDVWIALSEVDTELQGDERLKEWKEKAESKCQSFTAAYDSARDYDEAEKPALALAWYLSALSEAPATMAKLKPRMEQLGQQLLNE